MYSTLQEYHQSIISAAWMIALSLIPQDLVRAGAILLAFLICLQTIRPQNLMKTVQLRLSSLEEKLQDAVDSRIMRQSDTNFTDKFARHGEVSSWCLIMKCDTYIQQHTLFRIRYMIFELYERTLMMSGGIFQEVKAVWEGLSLEINECIRNVVALERDLEVCSS